MKSAHPRAENPSPQLTRVVKRMAPTQAGAIKLAERYGERLVCVRYRHDLAGRYRYTTVEIVVDRGMIKTRSSSAQSTPKRQIVALQLPYVSDLHDLVRANGGVWDRKARLWYLPRAAARALGLLQRVV